MKLTSVSMTSLSLECMLFSISFRLAMFAESVARVLETYANFRLTTFRSLVSFGPKQRAIGEAAKTLETSNYKNTIGSLKRLVGRKLSDPDIADIEQKYITANLVDIDGFVGVKVRS